MSPPVFAPLLVSLSLSVPAFAASYGLEVGSPAPQSIGSLAFGADGILFMADPKVGAVIAVDTKDTAGNPDEVSLRIENIDDRVAALLGTTADDILINDLAANPLSGNVYLSVSRGRGPHALPVLVRVNGNSEIEEFSLENVPFARAELPQVPADEISGRGRRARNRRMESITDLAFIDGQLFVAGISSEEFSSRFRSLPFPFGSADAGTTVEFFHGSHGQYETSSPVRTFTAYDIANEPHLLAAYTCTPLVKIPVAMLQPGEKIMGETVAELGNHNRPLDMIVYGKDDGDYILMANSSRGLMKLSMENIDQIPAITEEVADRAGLEYETLDQQGVVQLDRLNTNHAVILVETDGGQHLATMPLP